MSRQAKTGDTTGPVDAFVSKKKMTPTKNLGGLFSAVKSKIKNLSGERKSPNLITSPGGTSNDTESTDIDERTSSERLASSRSPLQDENNYNRSCDSLHEDDEQCDDDLDELASVKQHSHGIPIELEAEVHCSGAASTGGINQVGNRQSVNNRTLSAAMACKPIDQHEPPLVEVTPSTHKENELFLSHSKTASPTANST